MNWKTFSQYVNIKSVLIFLGISLIVIILIFLICKKNKDLLIQTTSIPAMVAQNADYPTFNSDQSKIYFFDKTTNKLRQLDVKTKKVTDLYDQAFAGLYYLQWSHSASEVILSTASEQTISNVPDYESVQYFKKSYLVDLNINKTSVLPNALDDAHWAPNDQLVAYSFPADTDLIKYNIAISKPDGTNTRTVKTIEAWGAGLKINWSKPDEILALKPYFNPPETPDLTDQNKLAIFYKINVSSNSSSTIQGDKISDFSVSPDGKNILSISEDDSSLTLINASGTKTIKNFPVESLSSVTWVIDSNEIFSVAIKSNSDSSSSSLTLNSLNLKSLQVSKINDLVFANTTFKDTPSYIDQFSINKDKSLMFFIANNILYQLALK